MRDSFVTGTLGSAGVEFSVRGSEDGKLPVFVGYASRYFERSEVIHDMMGIRYTEEIASGAFAKTLADGADVRALVNHNPTLILGRTKSRTLVLEADDRGLRFEITPPEAQWARDLFESVRRGDVSGASFSFRSIRERWEMREDPSNPMQKIDHRIVQEAALRDISIVTFPAYEAASTGVDYRSMPWAAPPTHARYFYIRSAPAATAPVAEEAAKEAPEASEPPEEVQHSEPQGTDVLLALHRMRLQLAYRL